MRRFAPLMAALVGCAPTARVVTVERDVWQSAVVAAPGGAVAVGPLAERGGVSAEIGVAGSAVAGADRTREEGALGHLTIPVAGQGRLAGRVGRYLELGMGGELLPADAAVSAALDLGEDDIDVGALVRGGPQLRMLFDIGDVFAFGGDYDLRISPVQVQRDIAVQVVEQEAGRDGWDFGESGDADSETWVKFPALSRFATGIALTPGSALHLSAKLVFQETIRVQGHDQDIWQCTYDSYEVQQDPDAPCVGPSMPPVLGRTFISTLAGGVGIRMGRVWLLGQAWAHLDADTQDVAATAPAGMSLGLRVPLFRARSQPKPPSEPEGWRQVSPPPARPLSPPSEAWRQLEPPEPASEQPLAIPAGPAPPPLEGPGSMQAAPPVEAPPPAQENPEDEEEAHAPPPL